MCIMPIIMANDIDRNVNAEYDRATRCGTGSATNRTQFKA